MYAFVSLPILPFGFIPKNTSVANSATGSIVSTATFCLNPLDVFQSFNKVLFPGTPVIPTRTGLIGLRQTGQYNWLEPKWVVLVLSLKLWRDLKR